MAAILAAVIDSDADGTGECDAETSSLNLPKGKSCIDYNRYLFLRGSCGYIGWSDREPRA